MVSDWLKTQKKPPRTNQIRSCFSNKTQENGHDFQQTATVFNFVRKTTIEKLKKYSKNPDTVKSTYVFLAKCIENATLREKYCQQNRGK